MVLAAATVACGCFPARAQEAPFDLPAERVLLFAGVDLWRNGGFLHGGLVWSPNGLDRAGFAAKVLVGGGRYHYLSGATDIAGAVALISAMPGWRFKRGSAELTVNAGLDVQRHRLDPDDPGNRLRGRHVGLRVSADLWWEPVASAMTSASASFSTIGDGYWTRAAAGWRFFNRLYFGPEALALGDDSYRQWRLGLHATALKVGETEWSASAGYVEDSDGRSGLYGRIGMLARR